MSGFNRIFLSVCITGFILCSSSAWNVKLPSHIKGLQGSCLVIPCSFDYYQYPPRRPDRVVWYQYVSSGYPLVYDNWNPDQVIGQFKRKTHLYSPARNICSLMIYPVTWYHHRQKIYPWIDPEHVEKSTYRFFDTTVTIEVVDTAEKPQIMITGDKRVGQNVQVECSVYHTCPAYPPILNLNIQLQQPLRRTIEFMDQYKTSLTTMLHIEKDHQTVECTVGHTGGLRATNSVTFNAKCSISPLTISTSSAEFLEGHASTVTCTATYTCPANIPTLQWNYGNMPECTDTKKVLNTEWKTVSTLTFSASGNDHGRSLTCYALFSGGGRQERSIILSVKRNMLSRDWSFTTPSSITGMRGSCITIPCRFTYKNSQPANLRVIWYLYQSNRYPPVYGGSQSIISEYSGITSLIGSVSGGNCTLKIERLQMLHNQDRLYPWIDKDPITSFHTMDHTFYDKTTQLFVSDQAQVPHLSISGTLRMGEQSTVSCSVQHACPSAPPSLTLNDNQGVKPPVDILVTDGIWERTVQRTWTVQETDNSVTCVVRYDGGQSATGQLRLNVECPYEEIKMVEKPGEATEGVATTVICSVSYTCKKNEPVIAWNFKDMHSSSYTKALLSNTYKTVSNLTFIGSLEDDGKPLTCTARFMTGETSDSTILHIKQYVKPIDPHENDTSPGIPVMSQVPTEVDAGSVLDVSCSVKHTCSSHHPEFSWSVPYKSSEVTSTLKSPGVWETTSSITFIVAGGDGVKNLTCTAIFWHEKQQATTVKLNVKGSMMYQLKSSLPILIPVSTLVLIAIILTVVFGVVVWRKRKHNDHSLTPPPRPEKRKSFWSRFSRRQGNTADLSVGYLNNTTTVNFGT